MSNPFVRGVKEYIRHTAKNDLGFIQGIMIRLLMFFIGDRITPRKAYILAFIIGPALYKGAAKTCKFPDLKFPESHKMNLNIAFGWYFIVSNLEITGAEKNGQALKDVSGRIAVVTVMMRSWVMDHSTAERIQSEIPVEERKQILDGTYGITFDVKGQEPYRVLGSHQVDSKLLDDQVTFPEKSYTVRTSSRSYNGEVNWEDKSLNTAVDSLLPLHVDWQDKAKSIQFNLLCQENGVNHQPLYFKEGFEGFYPFKSAHKDWQYYSIAQIPTQGEIQHESTKYTVEGTTWFDHQWAGTFKRNPRFHWKIVDKKFGGWCWFGFNLKNGGAFTFCAIHEPKARFWNPSRKVKGPLVGFGKYLPPALDKKHPKDPEGHFLMGELHIESHFKSPKTKAMYPTHWRFDLYETEYKDGDPLSNMVRLEGGISIKMEMKSIAKNQLTEFGSSIEFWEGGADIVNGTLRKGDYEEPFEGTGFCESVGFQSSTWLGLNWMYELIFK